MNLRRTGKPIAFLDVSIGCIFFAHGRYWTRTSFEAASVLVSSDWRAGSCCNFVIDGRTEPRLGPYDHVGETCEEVEQVEVRHNDERGNA